MRRNQTANFRQQLAKIVEDERSTLTACNLRSNRPILLDTTPPTLTSPLKRRGVLIQSLAQECLDPVKALVDLLHSGGEGKADVFIHAEGLARHNRHPCLFE